MRELSYIRTATLTAHLASDGQRLTDLVRQWAAVYFRGCGIHDDEYYINDMTSRPDGGVDGLIEARVCADRLGLLNAKTVFQFKAGKFDKAKAKKELTDEPKVCSARVIDYIKNGFKLIWITGKGLTDIQLRQQEADLAEIVGSVEPGAVKPVVIDANRLCQLLSKTPAVACQVVGSDELFLTTDVALSETPHAQFPTFVPGSHFESLKKDIVEFLTNDQNQGPIKYIAGEPGIGKSRSVLEAIESSPSLARLGCYFSNPTKVESFFTKAKQEGWVGFCVIDEYVGQSSLSMSVTGRTIPRGMKAILIGHSHLTERKALSVTNEMAPLSEKEMVAALSAVFPELPDFRIIEGIKLSKRNLRLARSICGLFARDLNANLDMRGLEAVVDEELLGMDAGKDALAHLSLVPMLLTEQVESFCKLVGIDPVQFAKDCRAVKDRSGFIQATDSALYVGAPALGHISLIRLWREERVKVTTILKAPGDFFDGILTAIRRLPPCPEKDELLDFFRLPVANLTLADLMDGKNGRQILQLLTADPGTYLPTIHRVVKEKQGRLAEYPYDAVPIGRRDLLWRLRDLAQFGEYFEMAEEIVFLLALEETGSAYQNVATSYWPSWFSAYFDHTIYPYQKRLDLLEDRAKSEDPQITELVLAAISNPFPSVGTDVPSERVGGRLAPPELNFIHGAQIRLAAERIPDIVAILLETQDQAFRLKVGEHICKACFEWLEHGAIEFYARIIQSASFPKESLRELIVKVRHYVGLQDRRTEEPDDRIRWIHSQHVNLLTMINQPDPLLEVLEIGERGYWGEGEESQVFEKQQRVFEMCLADVEFKARTLELLDKPDKHGGGPIGKLLGPSLQPTDVRTLLDTAWEQGFSQFSFAALRRFFESHPDRHASLLDEARSHELVETTTALGLYQMLGDEVYYTEAARMLDETSIASRFFGRFWVGSTDSITPRVWQFIRAVERRVRVGEEGAAELALVIAGELSRHDVASEDAWEFSLFALKSNVPEHRSRGLYDWDDVGKWLLKTRAREVIAIAAKLQQCQFSEATAVLEEAAKEFPREVLDALTPKLKQPHRAPIMLHGSLAAIIAQIPPAVFSAWLTSQEPKVWETIAGHLPRPVVLEGKPFVPALTRVFWDQCQPGHPAFDRAQNSFFAHTFDTGVFFGHGVELFTERVAMAKKLLSDPNPGIRMWAETHLASSEGMLQDAVRRQELDAAHRDVDHYEA